MEGILNNLLEIEVLVLHINIIIHIVQNVNTSPSKFHIDY